jgi:hypothetical protein
MQHGAAKSELQIDAYVSLHAGRARKQLSFLRFASGWQFESSMDRFLDASASSGASNENGCSTGA